MKANLFLLSLFLFISSTAQAQTVLLFSKGGGGRSLLTILNPLPDWIKPSTEESDWTYVVKNNKPILRKGYDEAVNFSEDRYSPAASFSYAMDYSDRLTLRKAHVEISLQYHYNGSRGSRPGSYVIYGLVADKIKASFATSVDVAFRTAGIDNIGTREYPIQSKIVVIKTRVTFAGPINQVIEDNRSVMITADGQLRDLN
ncbi:MAG TPA: hypothetical protein VNJ01_04195 [Bacteriovoracaceae bacterium]|nr:hypothetical protein [Bacteriovoracaceae bacterium]